jgi:hypothetical protein
MVVEKFSQVWPYVVRIQEGISYDEILAWAFTRAESMGLESRDIYTSFSRLHFGFKDKQIAMEFKLRFG